MVVLAKDYQSMVAASEVERESVLSLLEREWWS